MKTYRFVREDFVYDFDDGWMPLMESLLDEVQEVVDADATGKYDELQLVEAQDLFGMLMVDFQPTTADLERITGKYSLKSVGVCEVCGKKGKLREKDSWVKALCSTHFKEWKTE